MILTGDQIRELRESLHLSKPEFAGLMGLNRARASEWEGQTRGPGHAQRVMIDLMRRQRDKWVERGGTGESYGKHLMLHGIPETLPEEIPQSPTQEADRPTPL